MTDARLVSRLEALLSEAETNIARAQFDLSKAKRAKAYWERAIAAAKGENDYRGEPPALVSGLDALVRGASI